MNKEQDYASDSDESDEDFCPLNGNEADSGEDDEEEVEEEDDSESEPDEDEVTVKKKQSKTAKGKRKDKVKEKRKEAEEAESETLKRSTRQTEQQKQNGRSTVASKDELESDEEADKSRSDALWADFLGDVGAGTKSDSKPNEPAKQVESGKVTEILDFAGESVTITKTVAGSSTTSSSSAKENKQQKSAEAPRPFGAAKRTSNGGGGGGGLGSLLNQLGKKKKMSVLEKSQMDWKTFKSDEGIDEDLRTHNKGKDGFLERQDFLQRTDLRQFEIEKNMRQTRRQN
ncbi:craniofacial development protein 1 [Drosophila grimshawi]|uniref:Craniofacial development protein 1 n=1 Tax=Drosophila grimshawi TaxID=7222 RepID=B4J7U2_DROGR|nr:craniofacial development protein 1 [Drosophila grimshawi]EDW01148.1 GH21272 [Drosophila grimshawi]